MMQGIKLRNYTEVRQVPVGRMMQGTKLWNYTPLRSGPFLLAALTKTKQMGRLFLIF